MKLDILAIGAHPDDIELSCSGVLLKEQSLGKKTGVLDLTRGELGSRGSAEIRDQEAAAAAKTLKLSVRENLAFKDGFFTNDEAHQLEIIKIIRKYRPEIILCNAVKDRHPDHAKGSELTSVSCFLSGLKRIETTLDGIAQEHWRPKHVYHYIQWLDIEPDFVVDISGFMDQKMASVQAYGTQFFNPNDSGPKTPINSKNFLDSIMYRSANFGRLIGTEYAEGFTSERYPAVNSIFDLK
ncbi:bacillithiol biosynthesis deacetylase BshB1 [Nonlabens xylanidelens]|uniref:Bacillithiol biosynthesis deacetylase BshB1 n=1 Tax=Nonlabens xylanidelens TaxID=191564 RepID=A0A2S6IF07_9FLAO|nr:bacillithiol biosynthesis deacetylase BshB1 [Nonlabens xylanidelens]PPK92766.1 bacillithiol biosynthesis deacetylase BshB1 [Nonlabens xylanidelens]PQJ19812.1 bacillithiol biosynthesis deacetylase BshB1 [Nonlabens xylanidelens]